MEQLSPFNKPVKESGYLLPWRKDIEQPCLILIENIEFIAVFSTKEKLDAHLERCKYSVETSIKQIDNTDEFLESVLPFYRVALDPYPTERMTTRFTELKLTK